MIETTRPNRPDPVLLKTYLDRIWQSEYYTNNGPLVQKLEQELSSRLGVKNFLFTANGTLSLQLALRHYGTTGNVVTTPYSYVATTNAIEWQGLDIRFADTQHNTFFPSAESIAARIDASTIAIVLTHVYGLVGPIEDYIEVAKAHNVPLLFDAAHAFGVQYKGRPISQYGDISSFSFHATKTFHTVEGGGLAFNDESMFEKLFLLRSFGHRGDDYQSAGINAKNSEVHAAYGLSQLHQLDALRKSRKQIFEAYDSAFQALPFRSIDVPQELDWNYCYYPIQLENETTVLQLAGFLEAAGIRSRRYFFPSLNTLKHLPVSEPCPNSEALAKQMLCLPMYAGITGEERATIVNSVHQFFMR